VALVSQEATGPTVRVPAGWLREATAAVFAAAGFAADAAAEIADALVDADLRGTPSHGVMLVPMYVERLHAGSVTRHRTATVVSDSPTFVLLDAGHAMGQLTSAQAVDLAVVRAHRYGTAAVGVRRAHHFGAAGRWAQRAAEAGCIGIALSNTTALMPAPGGAERLVGNNPLAIAVPTADRTPLVLDMALSAVALGRIRLAAASQQPIPPDWATDPDGIPTTDPEQAIRGMLLPAGGYKGFGLALMVDVLTGVLTGGGWGRQVSSLYRHPDQPNDVAHLFLVIDPAHTGDQEFPARAAELAGAVRGSARAPGTPRIWTPGEPEAERARAQLAEGVAVDTVVVQELCAVAESLGVSLRIPPAVPPTRPTSTPEDHRMED
jgi:LDH2 family malate/lactate/ureidoglycolate dehydrogenase